MCNHSLAAPVKGKQHRVQLPEESLEWEALERDLSGGYGALYAEIHIPGFFSSHLSGEEQASPRGKAITLPCGMPPPRSSIILLTLL